MAAAQALGENLWREVAVLWSIKGYHFFKIRPHESISMLVLPEEGNARDPSAMKVMMPEDVPAELLDKNTREGDSKRPPQKVRDIVGKQVGRVPANLCRVFRRLVEKEMLVDGITCNYGGTVHRTIDPVFYQRFERARTRFGRDRPGGGAEIKCNYMMRIKEQHFEEAKKLFEDRLSREELERVLF